MAHPPAFPLRYREHFPSLSEQLWILYCVPISPGITESGFIPGGLWTLSTWYTRTETAKRVMFFYFGNQFGQASSKLLAYGILHMRGVAGKAGWFVSNSLNLPV